MVHTTCLATVGGGQQKPRSDTASSMVAVTGQVEKELVFTRYTLERQKSVELDDTRSEGVSDAEYRYTHLTEILPRARALRSRCLRQQIPEVAPRSRTPHDQVKDQLLSTVIAQLSSAGGSPSCRPNACQGSFASPATAPYTL